MAQKNEPKVYAKGVRLFAPHPSAPDFVKGQIVITLNDLVQFCKDNPEYLSDYKGAKQLRLKLLSGKDGLYTEVDTYNPKEKVSTVDDRDLPF